MSCSDSSEDADFSFGMGPTDTFESNSDDEAKNVLFELNADGEEVVPNRNGQMEFDMRLV